jgi:replicative DNA helicase
MIVGPQGVGKSTIAQQLTLTRIGLYDEFLGMTVVPDARPVLYVAADRPKQIKRSLARMVSEKDLPLLRAKLFVWSGPLDFNLVSDPAGLARLGVELGVGTIVVDGLKDVAVELSSDAVGSAVNMTFQNVVAEGIELLVLHWQRKAQTGNKEPKTLDDVYGSAWITAGCGSVLLLWGEPGDPVVELKHLKQPSEPVGPLTLVHDHEHGDTRVQVAPDVWQALSDAGVGGLTVSTWAHLRYGRQKPTRSEIERARRELEKLDGVRRVDGSSKDATRYVHPEATA